MRKIIIFVLTLIILVIYGCKNTAKYYPQNIIDLCKTVGKLECNGDCVDGESMTAYYDSSQKKFNEISNFELTKEQEEASFAIHSSSVCGECYNKFELKNYEGFKEVDCKEFFQAIENKNKLCNGCVETISAVCC